MTHNNARQIDALEVDEELVYGYFVILRALPCQFHCIK